MRKLIVLSSIFFLVGCADALKEEKEYIVTYNDGSKDTVIAYDVDVLTTVHDRNLTYYNFEGRDNSTVGSIPFNKVKNIMNRHDNIR